MNLKFKSFHIVTIALWVCLNFNYLSASEEKNSTNSFCSKCNKYSHVFRGKELIIYSNDSNKETGEFYNLLDVISEDTENIFSHPFINMLPELPHSQLGIFLDYKNNIGGGLYDPALKTEKSGPVLTINPDVLALDPVRHRLFAHEFTHIVHYYFRPHEELWLKEAIAQLVQYYITGTFSLSYQTGLNHPDTSLNANISHVDRSYDLQRDAQYGHVLQYLFYLQRICGGPELIKELITNPSQLVSIRFVDFILKKRKWGESKACWSFENSFVAFQKARFFPDSYHKDTYLHVAPMTAKVFSKRRVATFPYSAQAYEVTGKCPNKKGIYEMEPQKCLEIRLE